MNHQIAREKSILGGTPTIRGTRVPISRILCLVSSGRSLDYIVKTHYPFLSKSQAQRALQEAAEYLASTDYAKKKA